jgi:hypothetical protein
VFSAVHPKKVPPPAPDGREGRLFPPEQSWKIAVVVIELGIGGNKILQELMGQTGPLCNSWLFLEGAWK